MPFADIHLAHLIERLENSIGADCALLAARKNPAAGAIESIAGGTAVFAGVGSPLTQAMALGLDAPVTDADLDRMDQFFRTHGVPSHIEVCSLADLSLTRLLAARGYQPIEASTIFTRALPGDSFPTASVDAAVRPIEPHEADAWIRVVARGFSEGADLPDPILAVFRDFVALPDTLCYLASINGRPTGGGSLTWRNKTAILYGTGTLPEFRRRGVQSALLRARLDAAVRLGCDLAVVITQCGTISQRNVERFGFRPAYTRMKWARD